MKKRKPAKRTVKPGSDEAQYNFVKHCERLISARVAAGKYRDNPALEAELIDGFDPAVSLVEMAADPNIPPALRTVCASKLLPFFHKEQSLLVKEAGGMGAPAQMIQINVASWAAAPESRRAIELQPIEVDARRINSGPAAPDLDDESRLRAAARASATVEVLDVAPGPAAPRRVQAQVSQARGKVDMAAELRAKFGGVDFSQAAEPDRNVQSDFDPFKS